MSISSLPATAPRSRGTAKSEATLADTPWSEEQAQLLLRHVAAGDTTAFEEIYHHYAPRLATFLRHHLGAAALVDEVVNEVMLVIWQRAAVFRPAACFSAWLFGIAWHKAMKARRQQYQYAPEAPPSRELGSNQDNPEQRFWQWEQYDIITRALESLPPEQRTVVELTYYHTCSSREIAQRLDEAEPTVRSRLRLARQRLAHSLVRQGWVSPTHA